MTDDKIDWPLGASLTSLGIYQCPSGFRIGRFRTALRSLRQSLYLKPFRIDRPVWPYRLINAIRSAEETATGQAGDVQKGTADGVSVAGNDLCRLMADVATSLWRARNRMLPDGASEPADVFRAPYRHISSAWDALAGAGMEVKDHTGGRYVSGMALKVLAFQPTPGLTHETVLETIKPSVFHGDALIQRGEVIVGTPGAQRDEAVSPVAGAGSQTDGSRPGETSPQTAAGVGKPPGPPEQKGKQG